MNRIISNPFFLYPISFIIVFILYALGWSNLYPKLSNSLILFFVVSFLIYAVIGYVIHINKYIGFNKIDIKLDKTNLHLAIIIIGFVIEFLYERNIPLISLIFGEDGVNYKEFGIKSLHVFLVSYNSFITVILFHNFLSNKTKLNFTFFFISLIPSLLIVNRGMFIIGLFSSFFVFMQSLTKRIQFKFILIIITTALLSAFAFGWLGNLRSAHGDPNYIPKQSLATHKFMSSSIPKEYYWIYLYGSSPLANFQYNINHTDEINLKLFDLVLFEMVPTVISKRITAVTGTEKKSPKRMVSWLTVGTLYSTSFNYMWWFGPILLMLYVLLINIVTIALVPKSSKYHVSTIAILSTLIFMNTFDNMIIFSGLILQLFYPIVLAYFENKKFIYVEKK